MPRWIADQDGKTYRHRDCRTTHRSLGSARECRKGGAEIRAYEEDVSSVVCRGCGIPIDYDAGVECVDCAFGVEQLVRALGGPR